MRMPTLTRPIVFLDLETTGLDAATDRIIEVGCIKITPDGEGSDEFQTMVNPGRPLSDEVSELTGITSSMLSVAPTFKSIAEGLRTFLEGSDLGGFGIIDFDVPLLWEEFFRAGIEWDLTGVCMADSGAIFKKREKRTLSAALQFYGCGSRVGSAHRAKSDAAAANAVLAGQLDRYPDLSADMDALDAESRFDKRLDLMGRIGLNAAGEPIYTFGTARGVRVADDHGFGRWMLRNKFPESTKAVVRKLLGDLFP